MNAPMTQTEMNAVIRNAVASILNEARERGMTCRNAALMTQCALTNELGASIGFWSRDQLDFLGQLVRASERTEDTATAKMRERKLVGALR